MDLKTAASDAHVTGRQLAAHFGVTPATVSRWLSRKVAVPSKYVLDLAALLKVDPLDVLPPGELPAPPSTPTNQGV